MKVVLNNIKMDFRHTKEELWSAVAKKLQIPKNLISSVDIQKRSVDGRKKPDIYFVYSLAVDTSSKLDLSKMQKLAAAKFEETAYSFPYEKTTMNCRPIIIGTGPAGLFCALVLAQQGYKPLVVEQGEDVEKRHEDILKFQKTGDLIPLSNIQFGEGGAGTYSDGKLNTGVKDQFNRKQYILETFVQHGADPSILYINKPHVGTDYLISVVRNMRQEIIRLGGEVCFQTRVKDFVISNEPSENSSEKNSDKDKTTFIKGVVCETSEGEKTYNSNIVVLAIGHSSRETFKKLYERKITLEAKPFAIGLRIEHPQAWINKSQYGAKHFQDARLPVADYKLTYQSSYDRGVYSFCMCPGGYVVNASSHEGKVVCNGMSLFDRSSANANSAVIATVTTDDFKQEFPDIQDSPLIGMYFQEKYESKAYELSNSYGLPTQTFGDFYTSITDKIYKNERLEKDGYYKMTSLESTCKSKLIEANLKDCLPDVIGKAIIEGVEAFGKQIQGFDHPKSRMIGVETRTSSPVKILRDEHFMSSVKGLYPCGEGSGYAGGIMSAAIDGIKVAEKIVDNLSTKQE